MEIVEEVPEHVHPLKLVDLRLEYPQYYEEEEEEDDDEDEGGDPITKEGFHDYACDRCFQEIHMNHISYYKCMGDSSCDFTLHKFCAELPSRLEYALHPHTLVLMSGISWPCLICKHYHKMSYLCIECEISIGVKCVVGVGKNVIHHPCHPHLLMCAISKLILCVCNACGKRHEGMFYQCTICNGFTIHKDCAFLPKTLLIQERTNGAFYHTHPLTISYSFSRKDQKAKHHPRCRLCTKSFYNKYDLWIYKCDKCLYYPHLHCVTSTRVPPAGAGLAIKDYKDADYPCHLHLPFPDETYSLPKHLFFQQTGSEMLKINDQVSLQHTSHEHPLILVISQSDGQTSSNKVNYSLLKCHNPMKKTQLLCNGCVRPIMATMSFYMCNKSCNFALHEWCTRLPQEIKNYPYHPQHTLVLMFSKDIPLFFGVFNCGVCHLPCNGFLYCCFECGYCVDLSCGFIPREITHEVHPNHLLSIRENQDYLNLCPMCVGDLPGRQISFHCNTCAFSIHVKYALLLPKVIRHTIDKPPMHLSYLPIENHKSEYFCEICEEDLNPHKSFYHCQGCAQSVHSACAPVILQNETNTNVPIRESLIIMSI